MFLTMFQFEWRFFTRQPSFYILTLILGTLAFLATALNKVQMGGANLLKNGPYSITFMCLIFLPLAMFVVVNFIASSALRDRQSQIDTFLYSLPLSPVGYQLGRFSGAFCVTLLVLAAVPAGLFLGTLMPWVDPSRLGAHRITYYLTAYFCFVLPTLFFLAALFYALAKRFQSLAAVYIAVLVLLIGYEASDSLLKSPEMVSLAALLDPFGIRTFDVMSRYWTIAEKNHHPIPFNSLFFFNRLIWTTLGLITLGIFGGFFKPLGLLQSAKRTPKTGTKTLSPTRFAPPWEPVGDTRRLFPRSLFLSRLKFEVLLTLKSLPLIFMLVLATVLLLVLFMEPSANYGTPYLPVTFRMIDILQNGLYLFAIAILTYYSAEVMGRETDCGIKDVLDAYPVSAWILWWSKLASVWVVLWFLLGLGFALAIGFQTSVGYTHFELEHYAVRLLFFTALPWMMLAILAFFFHALFQNKYLGMAAFILFFFVDAGLDAAGWHHHLFHFAQSPDFEYSDMNGYGGALVRHTWYMLFWIGACALLVLFSFRLWQRRPKQSFGSSFRSGEYWVAAGALGLMLVAATVVFYNTRILNQERPFEQRLAERAQYEMRYGNRELDSVPNINRMKANVAIYPEKRRVEGVAEVEMENRTSHPITRCFISLPDFSPEFEIVIPGGRLEKEAGPMKTHEYVFDPPLAPGEVRTCQIRVIRQQLGFSDGVEDIQVVKNGTFLTNFELFPWFGYRSDFEILDGHHRRKFDLPPAQRAHPLEDSRHYETSFIGLGNSYLTFEATVSTSPDQIAMAPGYLQKEWLDKDRRYFHYQMDAPMVNFYAFTSARLNRATIQHRDIAIEVLHHPQHHLAVASMLEGAKAALDYCTEAFGPYQHRQVRIVEFPRYRKYAQSFANTIPFSEQGFLFDTRNPRTVDSAFITTAHELAHQWWGHQVGAANVQGANTLIESLTDYTALMITKNHFGEGILRNLLTYELHGYLRGRTREPIAEMPLMRSENQDYIHYHKGSIIMLALRDLLGEERLNLALRNYLNEFQYRSTPYPTTQNLLDHLENVSSEEEWHSIQPWFQKMEVYDLQVTAGSVNPRSDGQYEVLLTVKAHRFDADSSGNETEIPLSESIDIALFRNNPDNYPPDKDPIYLAKHPLHTGDNQIRIVVDELPGFACVDPLIRRIDRNSDDNLIRF